MLYPPPSFPTGDVEEKVRETFSTHGFSEAILRKVLNLAPDAPLHSVPLPLIHQRIRDLPLPLRTLFQLFVEEEGQDVIQLDHGLGTHALQALQACGLLTLADDQARATHRVIPMGEFWIASDLHGSHGCRDLDYVPGPGGPTRMLRDLSIPCRAGSVLDLGCGSGALALHAARSAASVVATDLNPRALGFTKFNAGLNSVGTIECREGDLFEPVAGDRFDLILSNPPYVISPVRTYFYRDSGGNIIRKILEEAPAHLAPAGYLQMMAEWPEPTHGGWQRWIGEWTAGSGCDAWVLRLRSLAPTTHAWQWLAQEYAGETIPEEAFRSWTDHLEARGTGSVGMGHVVIRNSNRGAPLQEFRGAPPLSKGPKGEHLLSWLNAQSLLASIQDISELLDLPLVASPYLVREDVRRPSGQGWTPASIRLRLKDGLRFGAEVDPIAAAVVGLLDGFRTPREVLQRVCRVKGVSHEALLEGLPEALSALVALGLVGSSRPSASGL